jgi:hypothetical protein
MPADTRGFAQHLAAWMGERGPGNFFTGCLMDERKRDSMIAYLRHRMEDFGISPDDLASFLATRPAGSDKGR